MARPHKSSKAIMITAGKTVLSAFWQEIRQPRTPKESAPGLPATKNTPWIMIKLWFIGGSERLHFFSFFVCGGLPRHSNVFHVLLVLILLLHMFIMINWPMIMINTGFIMINFMEIQGLILNNSIVDFFLIMINLREMLPLANYRSWQ